MFQQFSPNTRGMLAMMGSSILFAFSDSLSKLASLHWSVAQLLFIRSIFAILMLVSVLHWTGEGRKITLLANPLVIFRSVIEACVALLFVSALAMMPLADLTTILMLTPLVITAVATLFLGEQVGWRRWSAIVVGFFGLLMVVQPGGSASEAPNYLFAASLGLLSVFGVALRDIITRKISTTVPSLVITLGTACATLVGSGILGWFEPWRPFSWPPTFEVAGAAAIVTLGNLLVIISCRGVDLSVVAPFRYTAVLWAIGLGYVAFGDVPNALSMAGMGVIVASGIYLMHRERVRQQALSTKVEPHA